MDYTFCHFSNFFLYHLYCLKGSSLSSCGWKWFFNFLNIWVGIWEIRIGKIPAFCGQMTKLKANVTLWVFKTTLLMVSANADAVFNSGLFSLFKFSLSSLVLVISFWILIKLLSSKFSVIWSSSTCFR